MISNKKNFRSILFAAAIIFLITGCLSTSNFDDVSDHPPVRLAFQIDRSVELIRTYYRWDEVSKTVNPNHLRYAGISAIRQNIAANYPSEMTVEISLDDQTIKRAVADWYQSKISSFYTDYIAGTHNGRSTTKTRELLVSWNGNAPVRTADDGTRYYQMTAVRELKLSWLSGQHQTSAIHTTIFEVGISDTPESIDVSIELSDIESKLAKVNIFQDVAHIEMEYDRVNDAQSTSQSILRYLSRDLDQSPYETMSERIVSKVREEIRQQDLQAQSNERASQARRVVNSERGTGVCKVGTLRTVIARTSFSNSYHDMEIQLQGRLLQANRSQLSVQVTGFAPTRRGASFRGDSPQFNGSPIRLGQEFFDTVNGWFPCDL